MRLKEFTVHSVRNIYSASFSICQKKNPRKNPAVCKVPNYKRSLFKE
jgi:hypothetical protein